nr:putative phage tail fiber protein [uncultured Mediterranean phage uvMED]BAR17140.1 putative phage tail fiber protein [uncultured Mediterranean phage uvMED]
MATISIADSDARVQYTQAVTANSTTLTIDFPFFSLDDINVIVTSAAGTDTTLTRGTGTGTFAVSGTSVDDGFSGGNITLGDTYSDAATKFTIFRDIPVTRTTDFPTSGPFNISALNTELDKLFAIEQELETKIGRTMKLADSDTAATLSLPNLDTRKGTTLAFNTTTGLPEAGPKIGDVSTIAAITADIAALADIEDGTTATDAISGLAAIKANVTTVAGISSNVTTVAGVTTNMQTIADNLSAVQNAATNATTATTKASEAATSATNAASSATSAASSATTATTKASEASTSATNAASSASTASGHKDTATTKASEAASSATAAASSASTASTQASNASTSASTSSTQATNSANSATASANSATAAANSATAAASSATAAASSQTAAASSAAAAATALDSFDDRYLGVKSSNPTQDNDGNALVSGALYFNDSANEMRVYDGANWIAATSAGNVSLILYEYTATSNQTTFSGSDDNSATLSYTVDNLQVVMNGVILDPSDYTATNGTSVVLASGAATNDLINIYAFKSFTTADMVSKTNGGTFAGAVTFGGGADFGDNVKARFGTGNDLEIFHDGSASIVYDNGTGPLNLQTNNSNINIKGGGSASDTMAIFKSTEGVELYYNAVKKFETTSTGVDVTGRVIATGFVEAEGGNAPSGGFQIKDTGGTARPRITNDASNATVIRAGSATGNVKFNNFANTTELVHITDGGSMGIGTAPDRNFHVESGSDTYVRVSGNRGNGNDLHIGNIEFENTFGSAGVVAEIKVLTGNSGTQSTKGQLAFYTDDGSGLAERLKITSGGNVGIGEESPGDYYSNSLVVKAPDEGGITIAVADTYGYRSYLCFADDDSGAARYAGYVSYDHQDNRMSFGTSSSTRMNITGSGYLESPPTYSNTTAAAANVHIEASAGQFYRSTSSRRYKNTITDATHGLTELLTLRPVTYKGNNDGDTVFGGLIAEEVHDAGLTEFVQYNDDNEPDALAYGNMVSLCIKAIQEQQVTITALEARIAALEAAE